MNVRTLCLAVLNTGESTGYEIRKLATDGHFSHFVDASYGSIYPALARMEADGLVESREEVQAGKPNRRVYAITDAGRAEFLDALYKPVQPDIFKSEFLLLAVFADLVQRERVVQAIDDQIAFLRGELKIVDDSIAKVEMPSAPWVAGYAQHCLQSSLDYLLKTRSELEAMAGTSLNAAPELIAAE